MKIAMVAEAEQVKLERFALDHLLAWDIADGEGCEIRLPGHGAERGKLGAVKCDPVVALRMLVDKGLQNRCIVCCRIRNLADAKFCNSL